MDAVLEIVTRVRQVRGELGVPPSTKVRLGFPLAARALVQRHDAGLRSLSGAGEIVFADGDPPPSAAVVPAAGHMVRVELDDPKLLADEQRRLEKLSKSLEKDLQTVSKKLENPEFLARAKPEVVEGEREKHARLGAEEGAVRERLERLRRLLGPDA